MCAAPEEQLVCRRCAYLVSTSEGVLAHTIYVHGVRARP